MSGLKEETVGSSMCGKRFCEGAVKYKHSFKIYLFMCSFSQNKRGYLQTMPGQGLNNTLDSNQGAHESLSNNHHHYFWLFSPTVL